MDQAETLEHPEHLSRKAGRHVRIIDDIAEDRRPSLNVADAFLEIDIAVEILLVGAHRPSGLGVLGVWILGCFGQSGSSCPPCGVGHGG